MYPDEVVAAVVHVGCIGAFGMRGSRYVPAQPLKGQISE